MFKDERRHKVWNELGQCELSCFRGILSWDVFQETAQRAGVKIVECPLSVVNLAWLGIAAAIHRTLNWGEVLGQVLELVQEAEGFCGPKPKRKNGKAGEKRETSCSKHNPHGTDGVSVTEEAFAQARQKMPLQFWVSLLVVLGERFEKRRRDMVLWKTFRLLALDGTDITLPAYGPLKKHFGLPRGRRGAGRAPKARMAMLQLPLTRMPYRYELAPWKVSEITLAQRLLAHLRAKDLVLMDRGFWSYWLMAAIDQRQAFFGIRVKAGSDLKTIKRLGPKERIVRWSPSAKQHRKWKRHGHDVPATMDLRIIDYQIPGFRPSAIATNVLDPKVISRDDWTRLTTECAAAGDLLPGLYHCRWEIETTFKELKKTQQWDRPHWLRSRTPRSIEYEVAGHVMFYFLTRWLMVQAAHETKQNPRRLSFLKTLRALDQAVPVLSRATPQRVAQILLPNLRKKISRSKVPYRPGRHYSRPGDTKSKYKGRNYYQPPAKIPSAKT
jgi:hypothetical protein